MSGKYIVSNGKVRENENLKIMATLLLLMSTVHTYHYNILYISPQSIPQPIFLNYTEHISLIPWPILTYSTVIDLSFKIAYIEENIMIFH